MTSLSPDPLSDPRTTDALAPGPQPGGPDSRDLLPGAWLAGRYEILARIGRGGAGWVYSARDHREGGRVALKVLSRRQGQAIERRAAHEIGLTRGIDHPNVVRALELECMDGRSVLVMELVDGEPVARLLRRSGPLPIGRAIAIARDVAMGLEGAHGKGVVHRDLKPGNVILDRDGRAKIADFGLAIAAASWDDRSRHVVVGTPEYMAPEQVEGRACDQRADVYALGVMLYEMLTGELPFKGSGPLDTALERLRRDPQDPCKRNAALPRWLGDLVLSCLAREPAERVASMSDVLLLLEHGEAHEAERPTRPLAALQAATRRRHLLQGLAVAGAALLLVVVGALSAPVVFEQSATAAPLLADGVVRVAVAEGASATGEPVSRVVAAGVVEALRARLGRVDGVVVIDAPSEGPTPASVEQVWSLNVLSLGERVRVVATVTRYPGAERWLTIEESYPWEGSWEHVDAIADTMIRLYGSRLDKER